MDIFSKAVSATAVGATSRELSVAADRSLRAGEQNECIALIVRIYRLFDDLNKGSSSDLASSLVSAGSWASGKDGCELVGDLHVRC